MNHDDGSMRAGPLWQDEKSADSVSSALEFNGLGFQPAGPRNERRRKQAVEPLRANYAARSTCTAVP